MPRVLRIINRFNLGGPTYNAAYLTRYLPTNYETLLVGGIKEDDEESSEYIVRNLGIEPIVIPEMRRQVNAQNDLVAYRKIMRLINEFKPDIVHTHASKAGTIGRLAAIRSHVPVIVHTFHGHVFHSYFSSKQTKIFLNIERGLAEHTSRIIAISQKQKDELCDTFKIAPSEKFSIVPLGFDLQRFTEDKEQRRSKFRATFNIADDEVAIGIVGRLAPVKNHHLFIDAIAKAKQLTTCKLRAFVIGDGELKADLVAQCAERGLSVATTDGYEPAEVADVTFTSWIRNVEVVYPGLDVVAMTSLNEGTPVSLIEAQAANLPIVTTNVGGIENIVLPDDTAVLAANGDADDFVKKLLPVVENTEMRRRMALNGWIYVKDKFHYTRLVADVDKLYGELLSNVENRRRR
jgi:glycosyltransferase involved in cell wall biosynthesis